ncbi:MAG: hypothetical protein DI571_13935 [Arsenicicoccus sp.]|nr:MAG: hypothetical protein DI571_13935 [Arsenicicoccus sp.]
MFYPLPVSLNIKNDRVHALAREAARITGRSQTSVIEEALTRLLADYGADPSTVSEGRKLDLAHQILAEYAADPGLAGRAIREPDDLYDELTGLPR